MVVMAIYSILSFIFMSRKVNENTKMLQFSQIYKMTSYTVGRVQQVTQPLQTNTASLLDQLA